MIKGNDFRLNGTELPQCPFGIYVDQAGYEPDDRKRAVMHTAAEFFQVTDEHGKCVFSGPVTDLGYDRNAGERVYAADFSALKDEGTFRVLAGEERSAAFRIARDAHRKVFDDVVFAYYYLRCGCGLDERHAGVYRHAPCHTGKARLWEEPDVELEVGGGWHDAGDYGRYVTAGACALAHLLYAYKFFPRVFDEQRLNIPEAGNGVPGLLSECRVELEWFLKMQRADGAVYHKATTAKHAPFVMPEDDTDQLYVLPVSTMATADFAAVCALAAGIYGEYDREFAEKLRQAAVKTGEWLAANPEFIGYQNPEGCATGSYLQKNDDSNRFWAWAELYALTGEKRYHEAMREALDREFPLAALGYGEVGGFGVMAYLTCAHDTDEALSRRFREALLQRAEQLKETADSCGYGCAMAEEDYHWGSNMVLMQHGMIFALCDVLGGDARWRPYAAAQLHVLLGVNALGYSYVTGCGEFACRYPHLRPAYADGIEACMPGMVSGGPNRIPADAPAKVLIPDGTPPMKCYADHVGCYSLNEITIYWNSPTVFVLAYLEENAV